VLLCYALAYHLSSPVLRLQRAVDRFGHGDLSARAETKRADEIGQLARSFNHMAERIETLLVAERRLLLDISHELRSPLARLGVAIELARSGEDRDALLDRIQKEADRLNTLIGELLQVTRAEGDPAQCQIAPVRLDQLVEDITDDCSIEAKARDCTLALASAPPLTFPGDAELLRRAIENIMRNAIRHAPPGTAVEVSLEADRQSARIVVRDYGPGVPEESLERIFDPFYRVQTDRGRASGGTGLGLAIARRAVELHQGKLHARNAHPGLLVTIELPLATDSDSVPAKAGLDAAATR
jgi:two-component system sensor histidine kinase CpxA